MFLSRMTIESFRNGHVTVTLERLLTSRFPRRWRGCKAPLSATNATVSRHKSLLTLSGCKCGSI